MDKTSAPGIGVFLREFRKSFVKYTIFFTGIAVVLSLAIYFSNVPDLGDGMTISSALKVASIYLAMLLFIIFNVAWAGAIHRCSTEAEAVVPLITVGALIVAIIAFLIMLCALDFSLGGTIFPSLAIFLFSGFSIAWMWFSFAVLGPFWW